MRQVSNSDQARLQEVSTLVSQDSSQETPGSLSAIHSGPQDQASGIFLLSLGDFPEGFLLDSANVKSDEEKSDGTEHEGRNQGQRARG